MADTVKDSNIEEQATTGGNVNLVTNPTIGGEVTVETEQESTISGGQTFIGGDNEPFVIKDTDIVEGTTVATDTGGGTTTTDTGGTTITPHTGGGLVVNTSSPTTITVGGETKSTLLYANGNYFPKYLIDASVDNNSNDSLKNQKILNAKGSIVEKGEIVNDSKNNQKYEINLLSAYKDVNFLSCFNLDKISTYNSYYPNYSYNETIKNYEPYQIDGQLFNFVRGFLLNSKAEVPIVITLKNIWNVFNSGTDMSQNTSYVKMNAGRLWFMSPIAYNLPYYSKLSETDKNTFNSRGYIQNAELDVNYADNSEDEVFQKLTISQFHSFEYQDMSTIKDTTFDDYKFGITPQEKIFLLLDFFWNGQKTWYGIAEKGSGYDVPYFTEKTFLMYLKLTLSRQVQAYPKKWESVQLSIPVNLIIQNDLIQILESNDYSYQGENLVYRSCSFAKNTRWYEDMQVWCPDLNYLSYTVNQVGFKANLTETDLKTGDSDRALFKYLKFNYTITKDDVGKQFFLTFVFTFSKGELYSRKTFNIRITVTE